MGVSQKSENSGIIGNQPILDRYNLCDSPGWLLPLVDSEVRSEVPIGPNEGKRHVPLQGRLQKPLPNLIKTRNIT
ncbi:hypothetical protein [Microcoleus sp. D3_18_C4]|uniref:hypothetical protein n=1 Tax=Microcoleus sp. D3_18_C4 TaxID=3055335 RepID=UPI002FD4AE88